MLARIEHQVARRHLHIGVEQAHARHAAAAQHAGQRDLHAAEPLDPHPPPPVHRRRELGGKRAHPGIRRGITQLLVPLLQQRAVLAHPLRQQLVHQPVDGGVLSPQRVQVVERQLEAPELLDLRILLLSRAAP